MIGPWVQTSVYHVPVIDFHYTAVMTNTAPTGAYRGAGRPEAIYNIERLIDEAARVSGIDRLEIRRRNFIRPDQFPYQNPMGQTYDTGDFGRMMAQGLKIADWEGFAARAAASAPASASGSATDATSSADPSWAPRSSPRRSRSTWTPPAR